MGCFSLGVVVEIKLIKNLQKKLSDRKQKKKLEEQEQLMRVLQRPENYRKRVAAKFATNTTKRTGSR